MTPIDKQTTEGSIPDLITCPICGVTPNQPEDEGQDVWVIGCPNHKSDITITAFGNGPDEVAENWNRRTPLAPAMEALKFYADDKNYKDITIEGAYEYEHDGKTVSGCVVASPVHYDHGKRARSALQGPAVKLQHKPDCEDKDYVPNLNGKSNA